MSWTTIFGRGLDGATRSVMKDATTKLAQALPKNTRGIVKVARDGQSADVFVYQGQKGSRAVRDAFKQQKVQVSLKDLGSQGKAFADDFVQRALPELEKRFPIAKKALRWQPIAKTVGLAAVAAGSLYFLYKRFTGKDKVDPTTGMDPTTTGPDYLSGWQIDSADYGNLATYGIKFR
ncbi:MAG: hypothetical protein SFZ03_03950 [Candidatus Melainabacteria bacterium]|nr:hypothetical protein [Candidatus Melainabacteria bacterium]